MDLDQVIGELMYRFQGQDNKVICNLGDICLGENKKIEQFKKVSKLYNLNLKLFWCDCTLLKQFPKNHSTHAETATDLVRFYLSMNF